MKLAGGCIVQQMVAYPPDLFCTLALIDAGSEPGEVRWSAHGRNRLPIRPPGIQWNGILRWRTTRRSKVASLPPSPRRRLLREDQGLPEAGPVIRTGGSPDQYPGSRRW